MPVRELTPTQALERQHAGAQLIDVRDAHERALGTAQGARSSFNGDLAGPVEWAYLADTTLARSLFAIQHQDDTLAERYVVRDNDTALLSFGNGQIQTVPMRFSLGLIRSTNHATVSTRVDFVSGSIR